MKIFVFLTIIFFLLVLAPTLFAQGNEITKDEYYSPWREAMQKGRGLNRRNISKTEMYKDGKVTGTEEWIYEYDLPGKIRYVHTENRSGKVFRTEEIDIGQTKYCKENDGAWRQIKSPCVGGSASGVPDAASFKYTVEKVKLNGQDVSLFAQYVTYKNIFSETKDSEGLSFKENKYWLGEDGLILREEFKSGLVTQTTVNSVRVDTYEYDPNIKIEAPIK